MTYGSKHDFVALVQVVASPTRSHVHGGEWYGCDGRLPGGWYTTCDGRCMVHILDEDVAAVVAAVNP